MSSSFLGKGQSGWLRSSAKEPNKTTQTMCGCREPVRMHKETLLHRKLLGDFKPPMPLLSFEMTRRTRDSSNGGGGNSRWLKVSCHGFSYTLQNSRGHPKYALLLLPPEPGNVSSGSSPSSACRSRYCRSDVCSSSAHPEEEPPHSHYWGFAPGQQLLDPGISPPSPGRTSFHPCLRRRRGGKNGSSPP